ncbi:type II toxin-antitoxin system HigB family toxin [Enterobacteriaceae bacterium H11S18]|uniref:type II toxin-antitoxin system HigB family toxin n=1 Tax=Dryocola clanedunensis TaxID=2925396 RepID=UPI0022F04403|nr:type II toxin-antitoxin system HigB family toxin [Dryocola clanedunensis]MCT4712822.1 type II toxin-antitoxin system HigB family toxin [Dryocola clanedunensis]
MKIISVAVLKAFWKCHPDAEQPLLSWIEQIKKANWKYPPDVKKRFATASVLKNGRLIFNIKGNHYRLVVGVAYLRGIVFIKFIGTHGQYDAIDANTVELGE